MPDSYSKRILCSKQLGWCCGLLVLLLNISWIQAADPISTKETPAVLDFTMKSLAGEDVNLNKYKGKVLLIVNVASKCGYTSQYKDMQQLYSDYHDKGLEILAFPCNQFGWQEPGDAKEIREFCSTKYNVTFDMFDKINVKGPDAAPLYKYLTSKETDPKFAGNIGWNFEKFLIGRDGQIVQRFKSGDNPTDDTVTKAVQAELSK